VLESEIRGEENYQDEDDRPPWQWSARVMRYLAAFKRSDDPLDGLAVPRPIVGILNADVGVTQVVPHGVGEIQIGMGGR
jgi:hypothetical protein